MADYYKQRHLSPKERDNAIATITTLSLALAGLASVGVLAHKERKRYGVGRVLDDTQTSLNYIFDNELALYDQEPGQQQTVYDPALHPDLERAWADMERARRYHSDPEYYIDKDNGDEYPAETIFEVYKMPRISANGTITHLHTIEGDDLIDTSKILSADIAKAKRVGYDLYIFQNGELSKFVPGVYGVGGEWSQGVIDFDNAPVVQAAIERRMSPEERERLKIDRELHRLGFRVYGGEDNRLLYIAGCRK